MWAAQKGKKGRWRGRCRELIAGVADGKRHCALYGVRWKKFLPVDLFGSGTDSVDSWLVQFPAHSVWFEGLLLIHRGGPGQLKKEYACHAV